MPDSLATAKVSREGFQTFATLWRNVHSLAVATDLHYNSMGFFRKADFKVPPVSTVSVQQQMLSAGDVMDCTCSWVVVCEHLLHASLLAPCCEHTECMHCSGR